MFDEPVEEATEWAFHAAFKAIGGDQAVRHKARPGGAQTTSSMPAETKKEL